jgi:hypothetical protein
MLEKLACLVWKDVGLPGCLGTWNIPWELAYSQGVTEGTAEGIKQLLQKFMPTCPLIDTISSKV